MINLKENNLNSNFKIVISVGDESGIGPEVILKALSSKEIPKDINISIVGSEKNLRESYISLKNLGVNNIVDPINYQIHDLNVPFESN